MVRRWDLGDAQLLPKSQMSEVPVRWLRYFGRPNGARRSLSLALHAVAWILVTSQARAVSPEAAPTIPSTRATDKTGAAPEEPAARSDEPSVADPGKTPSAAYPLLPDSPAERQPSPPIEGEESSLAEGPKAETRTSLYDDLFAERKAALLEYRLGDSAAASARLKGALRRCQTARSICRAPHEAVLWRDLGIVLAAGLEKPDQAERAFRQALELNGTITIPPEHEHPMVTQAFARAGGKSQAAPSVNEHAPSAEDEGRRPLPNGFMPLDPFHAGFVIGSGASWLSGDWPSGVDRVGPIAVMGITFEFFDLLTVAASGDVTFLKEPNGRTTPVMDDYGNISEAKQGVDVAAFGLSAGLRTPDYFLGSPGTGGLSWSALSAFLRAGYAWSEGTEGYGNCVDCPSVTLSQGRGAFLQPGASIGVKLGDGIGVSGIASYRYFFEGNGIDGQIQLGLGVSYW